MTVTRYYEQNRNATKRKPSDMAEQGTENRETTVVISAFLFFFFFFQPPRLPRTTFFFETSKRFSRSVRFEIPHPTAETLFFYPFRNFRLWCSSTRFAEMLELQRWRWRWRWTLRLQLRRWRWRWRCTSTFGTELSFGGRKATFREDEKAPLAPFNALFRGLRSGRVEKIKNTKNKKVGWLISALEKL